MIQANQDSCAKVPGKSSSTILTEQVDWACAEIAKLREQVAVLNKCNQDCASHIADIQG